MMLDESIEHAMGMAEIHEILKNPYNQKCAAEYRQLAEWFKELKAKRKQVEILARCLDGCPLTIPCDKMIVSEGWCEKHCKERDLTYPDSECWLRYAEVTANETMQKGGNEC